MSGGSWRVVREMAHLHVLRGRVDVAIEVELQRDRWCCPVLFVELIDEMPAIVANCFSSGVATADGHRLRDSRRAGCALTEIVGKSTLGRSLTGSAR